MKATPAAGRSGLQRLSASSPTRRFKSPPRRAGASAASPAGGTRLGEGLAEPRRTPRGGHTVARLSPATPTVTTRRRDKTVPIRRLHRGGRGRLHGPRRCAALRSRRRRRHYWTFNKARLGTAPLRVGGPAACRRKQATPLLISSQHNKDELSQLRSRLRTRPTRTRRRTRRCVLGAHSTPRRKATRFLHRETAISCPHD